jgi:hypothetical protein
MALVYFRSVSRTQVSPGRRLYSVQPHGSYSPISPVRLYNASAALEQAVSAGQQVGSPVVLALPNPLPAL